MDIPHRRPLWEIVFYGALALALLVSSKQPIDANAGPPHPRERYRPRISGYRPRK